LRPAGKTKRIQQYSLSAKWDFLGLSYSFKALKGALKVLQGHKRELDDFAASRLLLSQCRRDEGRDAVRYNTIPKHIRAFQCTSGQDIAFMLPHHSAEERSHLLQLANSPPAHCGLAVPCKAETQ